MMELFVAGTSLFHWKKYFKRSYPAVFFLKNKFPFSDIPQSLNLPRDSLLVSSATEGKSRKPGKISICEYYNPLENFKLMFKSRHC